eukprot:3501625-Pleurochrysis_carterae.AAC.1
MGHWQGFTAVYADGGRYMRYPPRLDRMYPIGNLSRLHYLVQFHCCACVRPLLTPFSAFARVRAQSRIPRASRERAPGPRAPPSRAAGQGVCRLPPFFACHATRMR